jgi:hypothetical protein
MAQRSACPLWVRRRHLTAPPRCPLYPSKQTSAERLGISVSGNRGPHSITSSARMRNAPGDCKTERPRCLKIDICRQKVVLSINCKASSILRRNDVAPVQKIDRFCRRNFEQDQPVNRSHGFCTDLHHVCVSFCRILPRGSSGRRRENS